MGHPIMEAEYRRAAEKAKKTEKSPAKKNTEIAFVKNAPKYVRIVHNGVRGSVMRLRKSDSGNGSG